MSEHQGHGSAEDHFDAEADNWDEQPQQRERAAVVATAILAALTEDQRGAITAAMEVGAGTGLLSRALAPELPALERVDLVDSSAGMRRAAQRHIDEAGLPWRAVDWDLSRPGRETTEAYDLVHSVMALHHIDDVEAVLLTCHGALRPGGWLAIADLVSEGGRFHRRGTDETGNADSAGDDTIPHAHDGFTPTEFAMLLERVGFSDVDIATVHTVERNGEDFDVFLALARR